MPAPLLALGHLFAGEVVCGGTVIEVTNPSRVAEVVGTVPDGTAADAARAVDAAANAAPAWAATAVAERISLLAQIADVVERRADELAVLVARENGSAVGILRREVLGAAHAFRAVADGLVDKLTPREHRAGEAGEVVRVERRPFGVVACIVPWNAPLILTANKLAPALAAGNTVVLKPSPIAPLGVGVLAQLAAEVLPPGVLNVLHGAAEAANALVTHRAVRKISFTGGGAIAREVMRSAAANLTGVHFELGGNDPAILLDDADLDSAADRIAESAFRRAGQVCFAVKRVYVPRELLPEFSRLLIERVDRIVVGDALDESVTMGPVSSAAQFDAVSGLIERARRAGRDVRVLGTAAHPEALADGHFLLPALVVDAQPGDELVETEQFGPVLPLIAYDDEDEAIRLANDTEYGLCSSVWSASDERALAVAARLEAGMTIINNHLFSPVGIREIPFGGWKQSGIGWEASPFGIDEYLQFHSVDLQRQATR